MEIRLFEIFYRQGGFEACEVIFWGVGCHGGNGNSLERTVREFDLKVSKITFVNPVAPNGKMKGKMKSMLGLNELPDIEHIDPTKTVWLDDVPEMPLRSDVDKFAKERYKRLLLPWDHRLGDHYVRTLVKKFWEASPRKLLLERERMSMKGPRRSSRKRNREE